MPRLIAFSGLPGSGKSTLARELALRTRAVWLRIDTIEQAIRESGVAPGALDDAGYRVAYALTRDTLRLGRDVIGDSVNPWMETRDAWRDVAGRAGADILEVEVVCSDRDEHRRRVEGREPEVPGLVLPDWEAVTSRDYRGWNRERLVVDTSALGVSEGVDRILAALSR